MGFMPRKRIIRSEKFPYHIITRSNHKAWFEIPMDKVWSIAISSMFLAYKKHPAVVHAFVLMSNHYHLVVSTPNSNIDLYMYEFNKNFSLQLRLESGYINRMFGGRYKWSLIKNRNHYYHVLKYVYLNPNKAKIVTDATEYKYSTLHVQKYCRPFPVPIQVRCDVLSKNFIKWLHEYHDKVQSESINRGLIKSSFSFTGTRELRIPPSFDNIDFA